MHYHVNIWSSYYRASLNITYYNLAFIHLYYLDKTTLITQYRHDLGVIDVIGITDIQDNEKHSQVP